MNDSDNSAVRRNISMLGRMLGDVVSNSEGADLLGKIEQIRLLSKSGHAQGGVDYQALEELLHGLDREQLVPVARAFSQFLNLTNIADQHHVISRDMCSEFSVVNLLGTAFSRISASGVSPEALAEAVQDLSIELVLTAHPTEITRRTLIYKYREIDACLGQLELQGLSEQEETGIQARLKELLMQIWHTPDFRSDRPTPVDEAKWGFAVIENSLWDAVPKFLKRLDRALFDATGVRLPLTTAPVTFTSWMGGDRDGNPNVTAVVTEKVLLLSRWQAADLYLKDVIGLIDELSMANCNAELGALAEGVRDPYRAVLRPLRERLKNTLDYLQARLAGQHHDADDIIVTEEQLWEPLELCYRSMLECGMRTIADRELLDVLRRVKCFGVHLVRHDIRQESSRHSQVLSELTQSLGLGDYNAWDESAKQAFLYAELQNVRPLIPRHWQPSAEVQEVLDTCAVVAAQPATALGGYVISMARQASDVLAVQLLLKEAGCVAPPPVVPLFETLDDLDRAPEVVDSLLRDPWYRELIGQRLMVMIGYSDSAKDAGMFAATWAQYRAQEELLDLCKQYDVELTLFHGRGGTIGRGGAPAHAALLSQPPGSLQGGLRVTEQGEMIRTKLGLSSLALNTLGLYSSAVLQANLLEPPRPRKEWREVMDSLAANSCEHYREIVRGEENFVSYFRQATPEQELAKLPLGSRPARRKSGGGIESLRAIPWIFSWSQNRLMLPAWLGASQALRQAVDSGQLELIREMQREWPYFETRLSMLEMVYAKSDPLISAYYDEKLVDEKLRYIGERLREQLSKDVATLLEINGSKKLLEQQPWVEQSIELRNVYTAPLNVLQAELLQRDREQQDPTVEQALMVTFAGVAAGMRNTG